MGTEEVFTWKPEGTRKVVRPVEDAKEGEEQFKEVDEDWPFEGEVLVRMAKGPDRLQMSKECRVEVVDGKVVKKDNFDAAIKIAEIGRKYIKTIKLTRKEDKFVFDNIDDLEYDKEGMEVITAIGSKVLEGVQVGKA